MANYPAGIVTAYGAAVRGGYTGTYEEFCRQQAQFGTYAQQVELNTETSKELLTQTTEKAEAAAQSANEAQGAANAADDAKDKAEKTLEEILGIVGAVAIELGAVLMDENGDFYVLEETEDDEDEPEPEPETDPEGGEDTPEEGT